MKYGQAPFGILYAGRGLLVCGFAGGEGALTEQSGGGEQMTIRSFWHEQQRGTEGVWERHRFKLRQVGESTVPWGQPCRFYG